MRAGPPPFWAPRLNLSIVRHVQLAHGTLSGRQHGFLRNRSPFQRLDRPAPDGLAEIFSFAVLFAVPAHAPLAEAAQASCGTNLLGLGET